MRKMTTYEAVNYVLENDPAANMSRLSKALGCTYMTVKNYKRGITKMSERIYERFQEIYPDIEITDTYETKSVKLGNLK